MRLLTIDGIVNLLLGVFLIWYPAPWAEALGLPTFERSFFASILGAVLFGVGLALLIERWRPRFLIAGLGLGGAIAINLSGGFVLAVWLLFGLPQLTAAGRWILWALVVLLVGLSSLELYVHRRGRRGRSPV